MVRPKHLFLVSCSALVLLVVSAMPVPVRALGLTQVTLSCSDGTENELTVDPPTLVSLKDSIEAMTLYPAGLSCSLAEIPLVGSFGGGVALAGSTPHDYAVGGGQLDDRCGPINFALNAHADDTGTFSPANGTFSMNLPSARSTPTCLTRPGSLSVKVDCLNATLNQARITGLITASEGVFAGFNPPGTESSIFAMDNPDQIGLWGNGDPPVPCLYNPAAEGAFNPDFVLHGNITVHDGTAP
jgi:hypothetical protein